jgi:hypothetical protein
MPLLNRSTRTKIVGALLATAALSVGAGALPATAAPTGTVLFHMRDNVRAIKIFEPEGGQTGCLPAGSDGKVFAHLQLDKTFTAQGYADTGCNSPVSGAHGDIETTGSRTYFVHNWGFKKK